MPDRCWGGLGYCGVMSEMTAWARQAASTRSRSALVTLARCCGYWSSSAGDQPMFQASNRARASAALVG